MKTVNRLTLLGRVGAEPVERKTTSGLSVVSFPVATQKWTRQSEAEGGESIPPAVQWHQIVCWGKMADACGQYLRKGEPVFVEGSLKSKEYEDKNGVKRYWFEVHAHEVSFLGGKDKVQGQDEAEWDEMIEKAI